MPEASGKVKPPLGKSSGFVCYIYCTIDNIGQAGVESYYNKYLKGVNGKSLTQTNAQGKEIENTLDYYIPSVPGFNLNLTLDVQMQAILEQCLNEAYVEHKAKGVSGIILNAENGGIILHAKKSCKRF